MEQHRSDRLTGTVDCGGRDESNGATMEWLETFRDPAIASRMLGAIRAMDSPPVRLMEVCGTHTVAICRHGIRELMPPQVELTSGPGCPVCVTATAEIDTFLAAADLANVIITTFGDLLRVPGSRRTLQEAKAAGADIRPVYSSLDALAIARRNPDREVVFLGVGFETTTPTVAVAIMTAAREKLPNFSVVAAHKTMPAALAALLDDPEVRIDGLICPGHVSIMIGADAYVPLLDRFGVPCVIAGFEPVDILQAVLQLLRQIQAGQPRVEIAYQRAVQQQGNQRAMALMNQVFEPTDAEWRGLGVIPGSGLAIREQYRDYDACRRFDLQVAGVREPAGCACGSVLRSVIVPSACPLFGTSCRPERPVGPCMVSSEGACGAYYRYTRGDSGAGG